jgi:lipoprotein signal peptidase
MIQDTLQRQGVRQTTETGQPPAIELGLEQAGSLNDVLALLDQPGVRKGIGLFGPSGSGKTTLLAVLARDAVRGPRTPQHRKVVCAVVNAAKLPSDLEPWQRLVFATLDKLAQQPGAPRTVTDLGAELQELVLHEANHDESATLAAAAFAHHFRAAFAGLVNSSVSLSNATFVVAIDHLDKTSAGKAAELLEAARYFLNAQNCATLICADEPTLHQLLDDDGQAALYKWMTARVDLPSRPAVNAPAATAPITGSPPNAAAPQRPPQRAPTPRPIASDLPQPCVQILTDALGSDRYAIERAGDYWRSATRALARRSADGYRINISGPLIAKLCALRLLSPALFDAARFDVPLLTTLERRARSSSMTEASDSWTETMMADPRLDALFRTAPSFIGVETRDLATALRLVNSDPLEGERTRPVAPSAPEVRLVGATGAALSPSVASAPARATPAPTPAPKPGSRREIAPTIAPAVMPATVWTIVSVAASAFIVDRLAKLLAQANGTMLGGVIRLEPAPVQNLLNSGLAIGAELLGLALCGLIVLFWGANHRSRAYAAAFGLIIGGLMANLFDRLAYGSVMNFVHVGNLPVFNFAHAALLAGVCLLVIAMATRPADEPHATR